MTDLVATLALTSGGGPLPPPVPFGDEVVLRAAFVDADTGQGATVTGVILRLSLPDGTSATIHQDALTAGPAGVFTYSVPMDQRGRWFARVSCFSPVAASSTQLVVTVLPSSGSPLPVPLHPTQDLLDAADEAAASAAAAAASAASAAASASAAAASAASPVQSVAGRIGAVTLSVADVSGAATQTALATETTARVAADTAAIAAAIAGAPVKSVAGRTGAVTLTHTDIADWNATINAATAGFLTNVTLASLPQTAAVAGQAIVWSGTAWAPGTVSGGSVSEPVPGNTVTTMASVDLVLIHVGGVTGGKWISVADLINSQGQTITLGAAAAPITSTDRLWINQGGASDVVATPAQLAAYIRVPLSTIQLTGDTALSAAHHGRTLYAVTTLTLTAPTDLPDGMECRVVNVSGQVGAAGIVTLGTGITPLTNSRTLNDGEGVTLAATSAAGGGSSVSVFAIVGGGAAIPAPQAPVGLALGASGPASLTVSWGPGAGGTPTSYTVRYAPTGTTTWTTITGRTTTTYTITGLSPSTAYDIQVAALGAGGTSAFSGTLTAATPATLAVPGSPSALTSTAQTASTITLSWMSPSGGGAVDYYTAGSRLTSAGGAYTIASSSVASTATELTVTGLAFATSYDFQVFATNTTGNGEAATLSSVSTTIAAPGQPTGLAVGTMTSASAPLSWTAPGSGGAVATYTVEYRVSGASTWTAFGTAPIGTTITVTGLIANTAYEFRVTATNAGGAGPATTTATGTTLVTEPAAPTGLTVGSTTSTTIPLTWIAPAGSVTNYTVGIRKTAVGGAYTTTTVAGTSTTLTVAVETSATSWDIQVTANNASGAGPAATATATTSSALPAYKVRTGLSGVGAMTSMGARGGAAPSFYWSASGSLFVLQADGTTRVNSTTLGADGNPFQCVVAYGSSPTVSPFTAPFSTTPVNLGHANDIKLATPLNQTGYPGMWNTGGLYGWNAAAPTTLYFWIRTRDGGDFVMTDSSNVPLAIPAP